MPRVIKKPASAPAPAPAEPETVELIDDSPRDTLDALMAELAGAGAAVYITVYRAERGQEQEYLFKTTPEGFSLDELRDVHEGGQFRLYVSRDGVLVRNMKVVVARKRRAPEPAPVDVGAALRDAVAPLVEAASAPRPSLLQGLDVPATITAVGGVITALRALFPAQAPAAAAAPAPRERSELDSFLKAFRLAQELQGKSGGDDGGDVSLMGMLRDLLRSPLAQNAIAAAMTPAPKPAPAVRPPQVPTPAVEHSPAPVVVGPDGDNQATAVKAVLSGYLAQLCELADADADPEVYAIVILDNAPAPMLRELLAKPDPVAELAALHPEISERRAWFSELVRELREAGGYIDVVMPPPGPGNNGAAVLQGAHTTTTRRGAGGKAKPADAAAGTAPDLPRKPSAR